MFAKIFNQIYDSSIVESPETRFTFMDFLILADRNGVVDMTHEAISRRTNRALEVIQKTVSELEGADPRSRTPDMNGARIFRLDEHRDWGWGIVNYDYFRNLASEEQRREKTRLRVRKHRGVTHRNAVKRSGNDSPSPSASKSASVSQKEIEEYCASIGLPRSDGEAMFLHWEEQKWPKNWKLTIKKWKSFGYLPSQKRVKRGARSDEQKPIDKSKIEVPERFKAWVAERYPENRESAMKWRTWADVPRNGLRDEWWREEKAKLPLEI